MMVGVYLFVLANVKYRFGWDTHNAPGAGESRTVDVSAFSPMSSGFISLLIEKSLRVFSARAYAIIDSARTLDWPQLLLRITLGAFA